jgi:hypothetical protein
MTDSALLWRINEELRADFDHDLYYLTLAKRREYDAVSRLSASAGSDEVSIPLTAQVVTWFIDRNPAGKGFLVVAKCRADETIIGYFLFYPKALMARDGMQCQPTSRLAYLCVHLFVDTGYRRRGIFENMTFFGREMLKRTAAAFLYTVPNQRSAPGFIKLGMAQMGTLPFWGRPLMPPFSWIRNIAGFASNAVTAKRVSSFDDIPGEALCSVPVSLLVAGRRNRELLDWRYRQRPDVEYSIWRIDQYGQPCGYVVTREMKIMNYQALVICDFWLEEAPLGALGKVLNSAISRANKKLDIVISIATTTDLRIRRQLWLAGFMPVPQNLLPQPVVVIGEGLDITGTAPPFPRLSGWKVTPFDWDVF